MFFDPEDYLERDPETARGAADARRLKQRAEQRARLCEAMAQVAAEQGFGAASAQKVFVRAGLGSGTFYRLYESREACLQDAFERCAATALARVAATAARDGGEFGTQLRAGLAELLELLGEHPAVARLLLVEILAGDTECREARQRWLGRFAGLLACERGRGDAPRTGSPAWLAAGALASVLTSELDADDARSRAEMVEELAGVGLWAQRGAATEASTRVEGTIESRDYESPMAADERRRAAQRLRAKIVQRDRILAAMTDTAGTKGYRAGRLSDVLERARVSVPLFYSHFQSKEECLLAAFDAAVASIMVRVEAAVASTATCDQSAEAGLRALVESLAEAPARARLVTIEVRATGRRGEERYEEALGRFAQLISEGENAEQSGRAREVAEMVAGAVAGMIGREVGEGRTTELEELLPELLFAVLAPYMGGKGAADRAAAASLAQAR